MADYIELKEFAEIAGVKEATIKRRKKYIPGLEHEGDSFKVLRGTRYPCDIHKYKLKNSADRRYVLLKMISEYKYISHTDLHLYHEQFIDLLRELLDAGLIRENNLPNHFGANAYDCTEKGEHLLQNKKEKAIRQMADILASVAGNFIGRVISEVAA